MKLERKSYKEIISEVIADHVQKLIASNSEEFQPDENGYSWMPEFEYQFTDDGILHVKDETILGKLIIKNHRTKQASDFRNDLDTKLWKYGWEMFRIDSHVYTFAHESSRPINIAVRDFDLQSLVDEMTIDNSIPTIKDLEVIARTLLIEAWFSGKHESYHGLTAWRPDTGKIKLYYNYEWNTSK